MTAPSAATPSRRDLAAEAASGGDAGAFRLAAVYGVLHAVVDLCTVTSVFRAAHRSASALLSPFYLVVGYDVLAFALQFPLGLVVDRLRAARSALLVGLGSIAVALLCIPVSATATMVAAGVGNAIFHISAGALVLAASRDRAAPSSVVAAPAGVYVAPGALGLGLGMWVGRLSWPVWPLGLLLGAAIVVAALVRVGPAAPATSGTTGGKLGAREWWLALSTLLLSVAVRSFVGFGGPYEVPRTATMMVGLPLVACAGKLAGGFVADRIGWLEASVGALLVSAPFIAFGGSSPALLLGGLLLFQTTMPVTLVAVYLLLPDKPATAFGLPCLALIAGALPTFYPAGKQLYGAHTFLAMILASAVAVVVGLRLLGIRRLRASRTGSG